METSLKLTGMFELQKVKVPVIPPFKICSAVLLSFYFICECSEMKKSSFFILMTLEIIYPIPGNKFWL